MLQGDTITRRFAVDPDFIAAVPEIRALLSNPDWRGLNRYVGSFDQEPLTYVQTILSHVRSSKPDPQTDFHIDTFHPDGQSLLLPHRCEGGRGPVRLRARLAPFDAGAARMGIRAEPRRVAGGSNRLAARGSFRASAAEIEKMGFAAPKAFAVPANTLVVADTVGFHARGFSARPTIRVEVWTYGRRNPFLPWAGLDPWSMPGIAERRIPFIWEARDFLSRKGLMSQPWKDVGVLRPRDPPGLPVA